MIRSAFTLSAIGLAAGLACGSALAAPLTITGKPATLDVIDVRDGNAAGTVPGAVRDARDVTFKSKLDPGEAVIEDGFSTARYTINFGGANGAPVADNLVAPIDALGGTDALTLLGGTSRVQTNLTTRAGRFNTTASTPNCAVPDPLTQAGVEACDARWFETNGAFQIDFGGAFGAFGFFGTDFGDFAGSLTLDLLGGADAVQIILSDFDTNTDGAAMFFGFYDTANRYTGIRFTVGQSGGSDFFGFDDLLLGQTASGPGTPVPEPGSLALVGASLLALAATRRRRKA